MMYFISCKQASSAEKSEPAQDHDVVRTRATPAAVIIDSVSEKPGNTSLTCPVCRKKKSADEERCADCNDELSNTCYRCDRYEFQLNGKLCSECSKKVCALCNRKKDSKDDDLCAKCHNAIEVKRHRRK